MTDKSKIFVDGNCIVCDMEIAHYKKIAPELFDIVDISAPDFVAQKYGLTAAAVNRDMHVLTPTGELMIGVDAFAHIWSRIDKYKFASRVIRQPGIHSLAKAGYRLFATVRPYLPKKV